MRDWCEGNVAANGITIHYRRTGGQKPPMLLLHGITDNGLCWTRVALDLQDRFDVVMPDARGHGGSEGVATGFSVPILAGDAAGVIRALGLGKPVVFGHSMGAIAAAALAATYPELVRALLLEDPPLREQSASPPPAEFIRNRQEQFRLFRTMSPAERTAAGAAANPGWHPLEVEAWAQAKTEVATGLLQYISSFDKYPWRDTLERIECPGLLITGDPAQAIVTPEVAREAVGLWKNGRVVQIAGAGHCIHRDRYEEAMAAVDVFLREIAE